MKNMRKNTSEFKKINFMKIQDEDKNKFIQNLDNLQKEINNFKKNNNSNFEDFLPVFNELIQVFMSSEDIHIRFLGSQLKIIAQIFYNLPNDISKEILTTSIVIIKKLKEDINDESIINASSSIALWYNSFINLIPLKEKNIDIKQILMDFKRVGKKVIENPKQVKELNQLFVEYSNKKLKTNSEISIFPFIVKYLQQIFKEVSYDGGILFNEKTYDEFTINFGKTCINIGENYQYSNPNDIIEEIIKLYIYSCDLRKVLYENKISKYM